MAFYKKPLKKLAIDAPANSVYRVYLYLASKQTFQTFVIVSPKKIMQDLGITDKTYYSAISYLKENGYIQQHEHDGNIAWLLNPNITAKGSANQPVRNALWSITNKSAGKGQKADESAALTATSNKIVDRVTGEVLANVKIKDNTNAR